MLGKLALFAGKRLVHKTVAKETQNRGHDLKLGFALFRDKRVPVSSKLVAIALGIAGIVALDVLEIPAEALVALALPIIGIPLDMAVGGIENVVGPFLLSAFALTFVAPKEIVDQVRRERVGGEGLIIDVPQENVAPRRGAFVS